MSTDIWKMKSVAALAVLTQAVSLPDIKDQSPKAKDHHHESPYFCSRLYKALRLKPNASAARLAFPSNRASAFLINKRSASSRLISSSRAESRASGVDSRARSNAVTSLPVLIKTARSIT